MGGGYYEQQVSLAPVYCSFKGLSYQIVCGLVMQRHQNFCFCIDILSGESLAVSSSQHTMILAWLLGVTGALNYALQLSTLSPLSSESPLSQLPYVHHQRRDRRSGSFILEFRTTSGPKGTKRNDSENRTHGICSLLDKYSKNIKKSANCCLSRGGSSAFLHNVRLHSVFGPRAVERKDCFLCERRLWVKETDFMACGCMSWSCAGYAGVALDSEVAMGIEFTT